MLRNILRSNQACGIYLGRGLALISRVGEVYSFVSHVCAQLAHIHSTCIRSATVSYQEPTDRGVSIMLSPQAVPVGSYCGTHGKLETKAKAENGTSRY